MGNSSYYSNMPFTPFHFGPSLAITFWDFKKKRIDLTSALIGAVIIDVRAIIIFFTGGGNFHDGPFHTFLGAIVLGILVGGLVHLFKNPINKALEIIDWNQDTNLLQKILSATAMSVLHILLDSPLYTDIRPFWPFSLVNPFYGLFSSSIAQTICIIGFSIGILEFILYWIYQYRKPFTEQKSDNHQKFYAQFDENKKSEDVNE